MMNEETMTRAEQGNEQAIILINEETLQERIYVIRGQKVMLDYDTESEKIFHCGASSKYAGLRATSIMEDTDREKYHPIVDKLLVNPPLMLK